MRVNSTQPVNTMPVEALQGNGCTHSRTAPAQRHTPAPAYAAAAQHDNANRHELSAGDKAELGSMLATYLREAQASAMPGAAAQGSLPALAAQVGNMISTYMQSHGDASGGAAPGASGGASGPGDVVKNSAVPVVYVSASAKPGGDGSSWDKALNTIPEDLAAGTEVWVARGDYAASATQADTKGSTDERANSFKLNEGVSYYGGFKGNETEKGQRDYTNNKATLTGERGAAGNADNTYTVVKGAKGAVIDGFAVTGGNATPERSATQAPPSGPQATAPSGPPPAGAGAGAPVHQTPEIIHADAADDGQVRGAGGGMSIASNMTARNLDVTGNTAIKGGGIYVMTSTAETFPPKAGNQTPPPEVLLDNVNIHGNTGTSRSGGVHVDVGSRVTMTNSNLAGNHSDKGGGMYVDFMSSAEVTNTTVTGNQANSGAGLASDGGGRLTIGRSTITGNQAKDEGGGLYLGTGEANKAAVVDSNITGNTAGGSGADTYAWHGNEVKLSRSRVGTGDVTSEGDPARGVGGAARLPATEAHRLELRKQFDQMLPMGPPPSAGAPGAGGDAAKTPTPTPPSQRVVYANAAAAPGGDGSTWGSAYKSLSDALKNADTDNAQVWAAGGTYTPEGTGRDATFKIPDGVKLYGGFAGSETSADQRIDKQNSTVLDGDIGKQRDASDNAYHVVTGGNDIRIDGVTVRNGNANGAGYDGHGGGMVNYANTAQGNPDRERGYTNIALQNVAFTGNSAKEGGAMYNYGNSDVSITGSLFAGNKASNGGAVVDRVGVHTTLTDVHFSGNEAAKNGGAYFLDYGSRLKATNIKAEHNEAGNDGGVLYSASRASQLEETIAVIDGAVLNGNRAARNGASFAINDMSKAYVSKVSSEAGTQAEHTRSVSDNALLQAGPAPADTFVRATKTKPM